MSNHRCQSLREVVGQHAILEWLAQMEEQEFDAVALAEKILSREKPTPHESALSLTLDPQNQRARIWLEAISHEPELAYLVRLVLHDTRQFDAEMYLANDLFRIALKEPRWVFMWLRDFGENSEDDALLLRPHYDWIAELIYLKALPPHVAVEMEADLDPDTQNHPIRLSFLAFAAAQIRTNE